MVKKKKLAITVVVAATSIAGLAATSQIAYGGTDRPSPDVLGDLVIDQGSAKQVYADLAQTVDEPGLAARVASGAVTESDYTKAVDSAASCVKARVDTNLATAGAKATTTVRTSWSPDRFALNYYVGVTGDLSGLDGGAMDAVGSVSKDCQKSTGMDTVGRTYQLQLRADPTYVAEVTRGFNACAGLPADADPRAAAIDSARLASASNASEGVISGCLQQYPSLTAVPTVDPNSPGKP